VLDKLSFFSKGKPEGVAPEVHANRTPLPKNLATSIKAQFSFLRVDEINSFTCERRRSAQSGAREDVSVYDTTGKLRYLGRVFDGHTISFWQP
jgi:hypothetical protein